MGEFTELKARDGHGFDAYVARPAGAPRAGLVVVQEIFGVNRHIRAVADGFAEDGFFAVAPALFDRVRKRVDLGYEGEDRESALGLMQKLEMDNVLKDIGAALEYAKGQTGKKTGVVGYCFGGTAAWLSATRLHPDAAVGYYGGNIGNFAAERPRSPVMLHFGRKDAHIPAEQVEKVRSAHPEVEIFWYDAGHGFNCDHRSSFDAEASRQARERTVDFLKKHLCS